MTPADLPIQAITDVLVLPSVIVKTLGVRSKLISKLYQHFRVRDYPYGLQDSLSMPNGNALGVRFTRFVRQLHVDSATGARLDTGG